MECNELLRFRHTIRDLSKMSGLPSNKIMEWVQVVEWIVHKEENWEGKKGRPRRHITGAYWRIQSFVSFCSDLLHNVLLRWMKFCFNCYVLGFIPIICWRRCFSFCALYQALPDLLWFFVFGFCHVVECCSHMVFHLLVEWLLSHGFPPSCRVVSVVFVHFLQWRSNVSTKRRYRSFVGSTNTSSDNNWSQLVRSRSLTETECRAIGCRYCNVSNAHYSCGKTCHTRADGVGVDFNTGQPRLRYFGNC